MSNAGGISAAIAPASSGRIAAIDIDRLPRNESGSRRGQEDQRTHDIFGTTKTPERSTIDDPLIERGLRLHEFTVEIGDDHGRRNGIDRDVVRTELYGHRSRQVCDA